MTVVTGVLALGFALIHLLIGKLAFLRAIPRSRWLSAAGGVAVAYVFLHVLPELAERQRTLREHLGGASALTGRHVYLLALVGLAAFYGLERLVRSARREDATDGAIPPGLFWLHLGSFAVYNVMLSYLLLHREDATPTGLLLYFVAIGLHLVTTDFGLRQDAPASYDRVARWVLSAAIVAGWALGVLVDVAEPAIAMLFAFLAGGIVLNVLKEELPEERESRFGAFALGAGGYALVLLLAE
jgi:zinc transporter ZupT